MRIAIRVQLALLVLFTSLMALAVVSITTWYYNYNFVVGIKSQGLTLTASLKAAQITADLELLESTCSTIVTRLLIQQAILRFYTGNTTDANWARAVTDVQSALASGGYSALQQVTIYSRNSTGNQYGLLNVTGVQAEPIIMPYTYPNGSSVTLGDPGIGYPPSLYPRLRFEQTGLPDPEDPQANQTNVYASTDFQLNNSSTLLLGPLQVNTSYALVSLTLPVLNNNTTGIDVIGYMTVVAEASAMYNVMRSREGLDNTGVVLLIGPANDQNQFSASASPANATFSPNKTALAAAAVNFVFPPTPIPGQTDRHTSHPINGSGPSFPLGAYPAALMAFSENNSAINNASSVLSTTDEQGDSVAVGYARPQTTLADWVLLVEQNHDEAWAPVTQLRNILLGCVFGTVGFIILIIFPVAHFSVLPIRRLKDATEASVQPPGYSPQGSLRSETVNGFDGDGSGDEEARSTSRHSKRKTGFIIRMRDLTRGRRQKTKEEQREDTRRRVFKIPGKVQDKKHYITDELTELTATFNEMSDELLMQYSKLEERVAERTAELEISKKAAEAANESKTLFIANISHELKTPLNGILGMCAVCMGEDDLPRIKRSLQVVYKSGDLLLHLLNDLLTFSKNQIGQSLSLEEREFGLSDIKSQIITIFDKQVRDGRINFGVRFLSTESSEFSPDRSEIQGEKGMSSAYGPQGTGRLKDMRLWGDQHRILQVIINLVSNSLKFTPEQGKVEVRIRCLGEQEKSSDVSRNSMNSKHGSGSQRPSRSRHRVGSGSNTSVASKVPSTATTSKQLGTALLINPMDPKAAQTHVQVRERSPTPPPASAKTLIFEFEVEDSGPGISPALQERVFEPFVQGDLGLSKKYGGTGLGLSICSQLAGLMGGKITLESTVGVGSTFNMRIPLKYVRERASSTASSSLPGSRPPSVSHDNTRMSGEAVHNTSTLNNGTSLSFDKDTQPRLVGLSQPFFASQAPTAGITSEEQLAALDAVAASKSPNGKIRVLVAEDNLVNQEVVLRMLKLEDIYDVTVAKDGQEAYDMVKMSMDAGTVYNLIFMDIQMPNLDGLQSTRLIRQMGYSAPIVALTAFAEESNVKECMDSGMDMFLSKPIRRPALKQVLKKFATIPEEVETSSLSRRTTSNEDPENKSVGSSSESPKLSNETLEESRLEPHA